MVNNTGSTQRVEIMARRSSIDDVWNEIFDSLVLDNEPPFEYVKNVVITTKTGVRLRVSALDFAQILERERFLTPDESDILSCKLSINFDKVRRDVDEWVSQALYYFDHNGKFKPVERKPRATKAKPKAKTKADRTAKTASNDGVDAVVTAKKPTRKSTKAASTDDVAPVKKPRPKKS